MAEQSLQFSFSLTDQSVINPYWLRMELVEPEDGRMSIGEAADFVDSLYNVSICGVPDLVENPEGPDWDRAFRTISLPTCDNLAVMETDPGAYDCQIRVYRSHPSELYKMLLSNGILGTPQRTEERVIETLDIEDKYYVTLDRPIYNRPVVAWQGIDGPDIHIMGNTLWWKGYFTGVIRIEFGTIYDLVNVHVHGINNQDSSIITGTDDSLLGNGWYSGDEDGSELLDVKDTECMALAFYHYQYEELALHKPENDDSDLIAELCAFAGSTHVPGSTGFGDPRDSGGDCFAKRGVNNICICGGEENEVVEEVPVPCPAGTTSGTYVEDSVKNSVGDEYIDCGNRDDVSDPTFYEQICCRGWNAAAADTLPKCREHYGLFTGLGISEELKRELRQRYGDNVNIIGVGPREGACGQVITTQDVDQQNCCDGVSGLNYDEEQSVEVIARGGSGIVFINGGDGRLNDISIRGTGFWLDSQYTIRDGIGGNEFRIFADGESCGTVDIVVSDGCSTAKGVAVSPEGQWGPVEPIDANECPISGFVNSTGPGPYNYTVESTAKRLHLNLTVSSYTGNCQQGFIITIVTHCPDCYWSLPCEECGLDQWPPYNPDADCTPEQNSTYYSYMCGPQSPSNPSCATGSGQETDLTTYFDAEWEADVFYQSHKNDGENQVAGLCSGGDMPGQTFAINEVGNKAIQDWIC